MGLCYTSLKKIITEGFSLVVNIIVTVIVSSTCYASMDRMVATIHQISYLPNTVGLGVSALLMAGTLATGNRRRHLWWHC